MATVLSPGDLAIVQYNSSTTDSFSFVFARDIEAGTVVNFTDNGWLAAGGFRAGNPLDEGTVTYTAPTAITAGTVVTLTGLNLDVAGDQIIAYQGTQASPTILYLVDLADGNNTVAGDATNDNTTALPPGLTLGQNAVAVGLDNAIYAGPIDGSPPQLFPLISNSANWIDGNGLPPSARYFYPPSLDLDSNNSTSGGADYRAEVTNDRTPVPISDTDSNINDPDGGIITFAQININNQFPGDVLSVAGPLPFGIFATPFDPSTGILELFGFGSHSDYQTAIEQIRFSTDAPVGVTKSISVWVFDDFWWSNEAHAIFTVTSAAVPPHLDLDANNSDGGGTDYTATFTNGGLAIPVADTDVSITDPDSTTIQSARITIEINRQSGDALIAGALPPGITASLYNPFTGVITLSGAASRAAYETALHQVVFDTTSISTADRIIKVTVNDGTLDSNVATTYMHVVLPPPNVPPVLDLDANNSSTALGANYLTLFTDGGPAVAVVDADVSVIDNDSPNLASATVTLTNGDPLGSLRFNGPAPGSIFVFGSGTHQITLSGAASAADYQTALQQITYNNTGTNPSTETRVIDIVVNDGVHNSNTAQALIQVEVVNNSAPVLDLDADDSSGSFESNFRNAFTENGALVPIADVDTSITDADSSTLLSATITLANPQAGDLLTVIGTLPGAITTTGYDPGTGVLTLTGTGTQADYATALTQIRYSNTSDDPVAGDRLIEVVVSDGVNNSNLAVSIISVTATNDDPVINVDLAAAYVENAAAVVLAPLATLSDADDTEFNGALVSITGGSFPGDGDILSVGGVTSNTVNGITFTWMPAQHALVFSGASSVANYETLLRQVQFQSSSDNPTDFSHSPQRTLTWAVTDSESVTTATTTIDIVAVNDAPEETVAATAAYTENGSPVTISPAATASDVDNSDLISGGVRIVAGGFDGDILTVNGLQSGTFTGPSGGQIDFLYDAGLQRLLFNNPAAVADYQALMQAVGFGSTSENPTNFGANPTRTLGWGLNDGEAYGFPTQTTQITITALNDAPINTVPGAQSVAEDTILPIVGVSVADVDSTALTTTLSVSSGILNVTAGAGVSGNGSASVSITGTAAEINAALAGLTYTGNPNFNGDDTITVVTGDGTATDTDTIAITVNPVNDAPVLNLDANSSTTGGVDYLTAFTDGGPAVAIVDTDVLITDSDDIELTSATVTLTNPDTNDVLLFNGAPPAGIAASVYNPVTGILTLTGTASLAAYQAALQQITFANTGTNPSTETRIIDVVVNDGTVASNLAHAIVEVTQVNNSAPTLDLDGNDTTLPGTSYSTTFTENGPAVAIADTDTLIGDPDIGGAIASATITLTNPQTGDLLTATLPLPGGITASAYDPLTGTLTLFNVASFADYETALEAIRFSSPGDNPVAGTRIIQVVVNDGINNSQPATSHITVVAVNDAPVNTVPAAQSVAEDAILPIAGVSVADSDSSALTTTLSVANGILNVTAGAGVSGNGSASVTIAGTAAQINAALAGLAYIGNLNFNGGDTLTVVTGDGTATDTDTIAITVTPVNDAPVNTVPAAQSVAEDAILPIAGVSVADIDSSALTTTLNVSSGILNVTAGTGAGVTGNGSAIVSIAGTAAQINAALAGLTYAGNLNFNGADTLTVVTNDGTASDTDTIAITVNPVNDAPVNSVPGAQSVAEDTILPIAGVSVADIDSGALTTTLSVAHGILNVTAGAGVTGNGSASVTIAGTAVQINAALAGLTYAGNLNFNGADTLTVATNDGAAIDTDTIAITVNPVNDAPVNTVPAAQSVAEDTVLPIVGVSVADIDSSALTTTLSVANGILNVTAGAGVSGNGSASVSITGTAAQINTALAGLAYTGNLDFNGDDTLTVVTGDGTATDTDTIAITVNPVNDAPVLNLDANSSTTGGADYLTTFTDGGPPVAIVDTDVLITDSDDIELTLATVTLTNPHTDDVLLFNGAPPTGITVDSSVPGILMLTGAASLAAYQAALQQITFAAGTDPSTETRIIDVVVSDGTVASNLAHAIVEVVDVNANAPTVDLDDDNTTLPGTSYRTTFTENGTAVAIADTDTLITDTDSTTLASATITLKNPQTGDLLTAGPLPPTITVDSSVPGVITLSGIAPFAAYQDALEAIRFSSPGDNPVAGTRIIQVTVNDGGNDSQPATSFVKVVAVNDAPVNTVPGGGQTVAEDTILPIAGVSVADSDSSALTTTLSVANGILNVTAGAGVSGNGSASVNIAGTAAQINAALAGLAYTGSPDFNGGDTLTVVTGDGTATDTDTIAITVTPVNDAPVNTVPAAQSVAEDAILPIAGVSVADIDSSALTTTLNVSSGILNVTAGGGVTGNGSASVSIAGTAAEINAALAGLTYAGNLNFNGADTLTVVTNDGTATDTDTIAITVNPVNDAPVNSVPGPQSVAEDAILPIAGVSVADVDSSALTTTLSVANGILNVTAGAGVTGNGSASVSITGTAAEINAALVGLAYTGSLNFNGADTLTVATNDGAAIDTDTIAITVTALNDAPINTVPAAQSVAEDTILPIAGVSVADIDSNALTTTLNVSSGILNVTAGAGVTGNGSASVTIAGTAAQINAALAGLAYTGNLNFNGDDTLTVVTGDGTATDTDTIAITVNPVNDAPVLNLDANSSTTGGVDYLTAFTDGGPAVAIVDTDVLITDSDDIELTSATVTLTNPDTNDVLLFNGAPPAGIAASVYNPVTGILTLTGTASLAAYQAALQQITFANTGTNPSTETRIIDVVVNDGTVASNLAHAIVEVTQVNNSAPTLDLDGNDTTLPGTSYSTTFTENGPAVAIADTDTLIGDPDIGGAIASATITLTNPQTGDLLTATLPLPGGITASAYDPLTGTLTLFNVASFADYETALEAIRFSSPGDNPVAGNRIIQVVVNDGIHDSQPASSFVTVVAANDAPELVVADATYQEDVPVLLSPSASLTDADDTELTSAAVKITGGSFPGDGDSLTVNGATSGTVTGITFLWDPTLHALVFTGASLVANYQALLQTVQFQSTSHNPTDSGDSLTRDLTWTVTDGTAITTETTTLDIVAHDDPAVAEPDAVTTTESAVIRARAVAGNLFNNNGFGFDNDPDGGTFAVTAVSVGTVGAPITLPSGALLTVNADGTFSYNPNHMFDYLPAAGSGASNLTYVDTFSYAITGGDTATVTVTVSGLDTNDVLYDSAVDDTLAGGIGDDLYYVNNTGDVVIEATNGGHDTVGAYVDYTLPDPSNIELLSMLGSGLTGTGSSGADTLHSAGGPNTLVGLDGDDYYYVNNTADVVIEAANGGHDTVASTVNYTLPDDSNIELLSMLGSGLTGTGSSGADTLHSSSGPNTLVGLGGDDLYYVNNAGDVVIEAANDGFDTVAATLDYTLPANVEALYMYGSGLTGTGSNGADTLYSSGGPNTLVGLGGNDFYYVNNTGDVVTEATNGGYDTVMAYVNYTLSTNVEAMYMNGVGLTGTGNSSANTLITLGANTLVGGGGNDTFEFFAGSANGATVADFDRSEGDVLVFSGFGTEAQGATLTQIGSTDQWQIHSGLDTTHNETITFSNHAAPNAGDFFFV